MRVGVIGAGIVGLATTLELVRSGHDVTCFEAAIPMGARSVGGTRIFRLAHARPELVHCAESARRVWTAWSEQAGQRLVGDEQTVVSGDIVAMADALSQVGAPHRIVDAVPGLPAGSPEGPFLVDEGGGVIQAAATGRFLLDRIGSVVVCQDVTAVTIRGERAEITTEATTETFDSVLIAAGDGTAALAAQVGIAVPSMLIHHARFTFALRDANATPPCWLERSGAWRPGFASYQHLAAPGRWAVGGDLPEDEVRWELGRHAVIEHSRSIVQRYVADYVAGAIPDVLDAVYCTVTPGLGDGLSAGRQGPVIAVWGDNLFKLAPIVGRFLARATVKDGLPPELSEIRHLS